MNGEALLCRWLCRALPLPGPTCPAPPLLGPPPASASAPDELPGPACLSCAAAVAARVASMAGGVCPLLCRPVVTLPGSWLAQRACCGAQPCCPPPAPAPHLSSCPPLPSGFLGCAAALLAAACAGRRAHLLYYPTARSQCILGGRLQSKPRLTRQRTIRRCLAGHSDRSRCPTRRLMAQWMVSQHTNSVYILSAIIAVA